MLLRNIALATTLAVGAPAVAFAAEKPAVVETVKVAPTPSQADAKNYADREQQSQKTADFQGGDMVVVGISGGAILVLLLLLLILA